MELWTSELENIFDQKTDDNIINLGKINKEIGWNLYVKFNNKKVKKTILKNGKRINHETKYGSPDFLVLSDLELKDLNKKIEDFSNGISLENPFLKYFNGGGKFIEVFGDYYHSESFSQGLSKEEHQKEVEEAYRSCNSDLLILWQTDIENNWEEICLPLIHNFVQESKSKLTIPDNDKIKSLRSKEFFTNLSIENKDIVINELTENMFKYGIPYIKEHEMKKDYERFLQKEVSFLPSKLGGKTCLYFFEKELDSAIWEKEDIKKALTYVLVNKNKKRNIHSVFNYINPEIETKSFFISPTKRINILGSCSINGIMFDPFPNIGENLIVSKKLGFKYISITQDVDKYNKLLKMSQKLNIKSEIYFGNPSDVDFVNIVMKDRKPDICVVFGNLIKNNENIYSHFNQICKKTIIVTSFNQDVGDLLAHGFSENIKYKQSCLEIEKIKIFETDFIKNDLVTCLICGSKKNKLGLHLKKTHNVSVEEYKKLYNTDKIVSSTTSNKISKKLEERNGMKYQKRKSYLLKDGKIVRRKEVWLKSWDTNPPENTILDGTSYEIFLKEKDEKQIEGIDFVKCCLCDFKASNISRHLRREHNIEPKEYVEKYQKEIYGEKFKKNRYNPWDKRVKKVAEKPPEKLVIKKEELEKLYLVDFLSDEKIGKIFNMTGEGILYQRKKFGINSISKLDRAKNVAASQNRNLDKISFDELKNLFENKTLSEISEEFNISKYVLVKKLKELSILKRDSKHKPLRIDKEYDLNINKSFETFRKNGFPYLTLTDKLLESETKGLKTSKVFDKNSCIICSSVSGTKICSSVFKNMYLAKRINKKSPIDVLENDDYLKHALSDCLKYNGKITDSLLRKELCSFGGVNNFKPVLAKHIYDTWCKENGDVLDPCSGWGGRLCGFMASSAGSYTGIDVELESVKNLKKLYEKMNAKFFNKRFENHCKSFLDFETSNRYDLVFTSPPYFDAEYYGDSENQSCVKFNTYDSWKNNFLKGLIEKSQDLLNIDGRIILNVPFDNKHPIYSDVKSLMNIEFEYKIQMNGRYGGIKKYEALLISSKKT